MQLELKERTEENVREYFLRTADAEICRMLPRTVETLEQALENYRKTFLPGAASLGRTIWAQGRYVGDVWAYCIDAAEEPNAMVSFCLFDKAMWGNGIMTQALRAFLDELCARVSPKTVGAFCYADNAASLRVLEKNGFACVEKFTEDGRQSCYLQWTRQDTETHEG